MSRGIKYMLISTLSFAFMQLCVKFLKDYPAHEIILFRSVISFLLTFGALKYYKIPVLGNNKKFLVLRGVFGVIALSLFFMTIQHIPLASAVTLQYMSPVFTAIFAIFILHEKVRKFQWLFFGLAFGGVLLMKGFDQRISLYYLIAGIGSSAFAGFAYNCIRKLRHTDHPLVIVFYFPLIAIPIMTVYSFFNWVTPAGWDWGILILTGIFTQGGQYFMTKALQEGKAYKMTSLKYLGVIYAFIMGYLFFGETYNMMSLSGILLVLAGVILTILLPSRETDKPAQ